MCMLALLLNAVIAGLVHLTEDAADHFTAFDGLVSGFMTALRVPVCGALAVQLRKLASTAFVWRFGVLASAYILAQPLLVLGSWGCVAYWRAWVVSVGSLLVTCGVFFFLIRLFPQDTVFHNIASLTEELPWKSKSK